MGIPLTSWKNPADSSSSPASHPGPFDSVVANKAKVRDPSILCCMGLFSSAPCRSYRLRYKATEPPRASASRKPGEKQTHVVRTHHPAFTPFMEAQLTSLCNHPREKPEKKRTEVGTTGVCVCLFPGPVFQGMS